MRIRIFTIALLMLGSIVLCGCHEHEWTDATCTSPQKCLICGETQGEPIEHSWVEASCERPKTCSVCMLTEGEALGHMMLEATCTEPETCIRCGATAGELAEHTWIEANCIRPKHCSVCGVTEGGTTPHIWMSPTYSEGRTCSICGQVEGDVLDPGFEKRKFEYTIKVGVPFSYTTSAVDDGRPVTGTATVINYRAYDNDLEHPHRDGYEWREVTVKFEMRTGCNIMWGYTDEIVGMENYPSGYYVTYPDGRQVETWTTENYRYDWINGMCVSYGNYAIQVPDEYPYLVFYVCSADYGMTHRYDHIRFMNINEQPKWMN